MSLNAFILNSNVTTLLGFLPYDLPPDPPANRQLIYFRQLPPLLPLYLCLFFMRQRSNPALPQSSLSNVEKGRHLERMERWSSSKARFLQHPCTELPTFLGSKEDFEVTSILILSFFSVKGSFGWDQCSVVFCVQVVNGSIVLHVYMF